MIGKGKQVRLAGETGFAEQSSDRFLFSRNPLDNKPESLRINGVVMMLEHSSSFAV